MVNVMRRLTAASMVLLLAGAEAWAQKGAQKPTPREQPKAEAKKPEAPKEPQKESTAVQTPSALRGPMRIDFDDRLVQGQTNKLGAVYLYQRKDPAQPSLLERRRSFREEIAKDLVE